jgi:hypothetical protein
MKVIFSVVWCLRSFLETNSSRLEDKNKYRRDDRRSKILWKVRQYYMAQFPSNLNKPIKINTQNARWMISSSSSAVMIP